MDFSPENTTSEYLDLPLGEFLDLVASGNPAPGGGSVAAVAVPLAVAEVGNEVAGIAARLVEEGNTNLVGDAITAVLLAEAGVRAAVTLAEINLSAANLDDDRLGRANELVDETASTARRITGGHRRG